MAYGEQISEEQAKDFFSEYASLTADTVSTPAAGVPPSRAIKVNEFNNNRKQYYVFSKNLIQDIVNQATADSVVIALGAHPDASNGFNAGSFTVVVMGTQENSDGSFTVVGAPIEYPPTISSVDF